MFTKGDKKKWTKSLFGYKDAMIPLGQIIQKVGFDDEGP